MPVRYWIAATFGLAAIIGWNVFLAQRDTQLFRAIEAPSAEVRQVKTH